MSTPAPANPPEYGTPEYYAERDALGAAQKAKYGQPSPTQVDRAKAEADSRRQLEALTSGWPAERGANAALRAARLAEEAAEEALRASYHKRGQPGFDRGLDDAKHRMVLARYMRGQVRRYWGGRV